MNPFEFATAQRIVFGRGQLKSLGTLTPELGSRVLIVSGRSRRFADPLQSLLSDQNLETHGLSVDQEPTIDLVRSGVRQVRTHHATSVVSIGGGSAIDAGKAIAALAANPGDPLDYLEVIGKGRPLQQPPLPFFAIPTTAGTGAEVTKNAVLASPENRVKVSLRAPSMLPRLAIVDPALTDTLPRSITASSGIDALTQLIEAFLSRKATPLTDALCLHAIPRAARALTALSHSLENPAARDDLAYSALSSGLALANAGLGAVHGLAGPLGGMFHAPHGALCAHLLPIVLEHNHRLLKASGSSRIERFNELGPLLTGDAGSGSAAAIDFTHSLNRSFGVASLSSHGVRASDIPLIVEKGSRASSMKGNPVPLTEPALKDILEAAL